MGEIRKNPAQRISEVSSQINGACLFIVISLLFFYLSERSPLRYFLQVAKPVTKIIGDGQSNGLVASIGAICSVLALFDLFRWSLQGVFAFDPC